jgi:hypothetical protein
MARELCPGSVALLVFHEPKTKSATPASGVRGPGPFSKQLLSVFEKSRAPVEALAKHSRARGDHATPRVAERRVQSTAAMFHVHQDAVSTTPTRSFEEYRYAIEAGLMSPHDVRCHVLPWERATRDSTVSRSSKRYHDHEDAYADEANKENADARCVSLFSNGRHAAPRAKPARRGRDRRRKALFGSPRASFSNRSPRPRRAPVPTAARKGDGSGKPRDPPG